MSRKGFFGILALWLGVILALARPGEAQDKVKLGWVKATANIAAFVAPDFAKKHDLEIQSINFTTGVDIVTALGTGDIDIGLITPQHQVRAVDAKLNLVTILGNARGGTRLVISAKHKLPYGDWEGLKKLMADLKAKGTPFKIGSSRGSVNEAQGYLTFAARGMNLDRDAQVVNIPAPTIHHTALQRGEVDMIIGWEPWSSMAVMQLFGTTFYLPYDTEAGDINTNYMARKALNDSPDGKRKIQKFVKALVDASRYLQNDRKAEIAHAMKLLGISREVATFSLQNTWHDVGLAAPETIALAKLNAQLKWTQRDVSGEVRGWLDENYLKNYMGP